MLPHKTKRGQAALDRLKVFDGIPPPYDKVGWTRSLRSVPESGGVRDDPRLPTLFDPHENSLG